MAKKNRTRTDTVIDCACVIHGDGYDWQYVEHLYNMLTRNLPQGIRFHVYTEAERPVPAHMIKHCLQQWPGITGPRRSWWYKMQLFDCQHHQGNLLYFDLDCVIISDLQWILDLSADHFWTIRDFRYLQRASHSGMNSSVMYWNVSQFGYIWTDFAKQDINQIVIQYPGDQDYLGVKIPPQQRRYFDMSRIQSWRWQVADGGFDFVSRKAKRPGSGAAIGDNTSILVFHGRPKPHECVADPTVASHWQ